MTLPLSSSSSKIRSEHPQLQLVNHVHPQAISKPRTCTMLRLDRPAAALALALALAAAAKGQAAQVTNMNTGGESFTAPPMMG